MSFGVINYFDDDHQNSYDGIHREFYYLRPLKIQSFASLDELEQAQKEGNVIIPDNITVAVYEYPNEILVRNAGNSHSFFRHRVIPLVRIEADKVLFHNTSSRMKKEIRTKSFGLYSERKSYMKEVTEVEAPIAVTKQVEVGFQIEMEESLPTYDYKEKALNIPIYMYDEITRHLRKSVLIRDDQEGGKSLDELIPADNSMQAFEFVCNKKTHAEPIWLHVSFVEKAFIVGDDTFYLVHFSYTEKDRY